MGEVLLIGKARDSYIYGDRYLFQGNCTAKEGRKRGEKLIHRGQVEGYALLEKENRRVIFSKNLTTSDITKIENH